MIRLLFQLSSFILLLFSHLLLQGQGPVIDGVMDDPHYSLLGMKFPHLNSYENHDLGSVYFYDTGDTIYLGITCELDISPVPPDTPSTIDPVDPGNMMIFFDWNTYSGRGNDFLDPLRIGGPAGGPFLQWGGLNMTKLDMDADFALTFNTGNNDQVIVTEAVRYSPIDSTAIFADSVYGPDIIQDLDSVEYDFAPIFGGSGGISTLAYKNGFTSGPFPLRGIEIKIPYSAFANVGSNSSLCLFFILADRAGNLSNELIPGEPGDTLSLGRDVDFTAIPAQDFCVLAVATLPIELARFEAVGAKKEAHLFWETTSEKNTDYFEVERLIMPGSWEAVAKVNAIGEENKNQSYKINNKVESIEKIYYRLKIIDNDGEFAYSKMVTVKLSSKSGLDVALMPNPAEKQVKIGFNQLSETANDAVMIHNLSGQIVSSQKIQNGSASKTIALDSFSPGIYILSVRLNGLVGRKKLMIR